MAYDKDGNYYFDPNVDMDDNEMAQDEFRRKQARDYVDGQHKQHKAQAEANAIMEEELKAAGIDMATYRALVDADPNITKEAYRDSVRSLIKTVTRGRDPKTGRFTKASPQASRADTVASHHQNPESQERMEQLRQKAKKGPLSEQDEMDALDAIFGTTDSLDKL